MDVKNRFDCFLLASEAWLNWSYLENHWIPDDEDFSTEKPPRQTPQLEPLKEKIFRLSVVYVAGMVGHLLCAVSKVLQVAVFIIVSLGLALKYVYEAISYYIHTKKNPFYAESMSDHKYRLYQGMLNSGGAVVAFVIDAIGVLCPPAAYHLHKVCKTGVLKMLNIWGTILPSEEKDFKFSRYFIRLVS